MITTFFNQIKNNQIVQSVVLFAILILLIYLTKKLTKSYIVKNAIEPHRRKLILNIMYFFYYIVAIFALLLIFGIELKEVAVFASSILAVLGIGFFAQWSILSNLTASFILFFYHPMRIGDTIKVLDKDYDLTGKIKDITGLYVILQVSKEKREVTIPNTVILYRAIELIKQPK